MTHDNTSAVMSKFKAIGAKKICEPQQLVFALDHDIQNQDEINLKKYRSIEALPKNTESISIPQDRASATRSWWSAVMLCRDRLS
jgi:homoaconitase/3-isopropylmalate dehydratase large subunit